MEALLKNLRTSLLLLFVLFGTQVQAQEETPQLITFKIRNAGVNVKGTFGSHEVTARFDEGNLDNASFEVSIDVSSLDTGIKGRDKHLKKAKYFDLENYPQIVLKSTSIAKTAEGYLLKANLTIKKTTLPIEIPFTVTSSADGKLLTGSFTLDRRDYGVGKNHLIMGDEVRIEISHLHKTSGD